MLRRDKRVEKYSWKRTKRGRKVEITSLFFANDLAIIGNRNQSVIQREALEE